MKVELFNKDGDIKKGIVYIAFLILKIYGAKTKTVKNDVEIGIIPLFENLKIVKPDIDSEQIIYALLFLYLLGIIEFDSPTVIINKPHAATQEALF